MFTYVDNVAEDILLLNFAKTLHFVGNRSPALELYDIPVYLNFAVRKYLGFEYNVVNLFN